MGDRKKPTLRERADAACCAVWPGLDPRDGVRIKGARLWLAGHRANRLTKAERAVVEAAKAYHVAVGLYEQGKRSKPRFNYACKRQAELLAAVSNLERAKGRK